MYGTADFHKVVRGVRGKTIHWCCRVGLPGIGLTLWGESWRLTHDGSSWSPTLARAASTPSTFDDLRCVIAPPPFGVHVHDTRAFLSRGCEGPPCPSLPIGRGWGRCLRGHNAGKWVPHGLYRGIR